MKIYCINVNCPNKPKGYAICTALMNITQCPESLEKEAQIHEENSQSNCDIQV